jgi:hypothetical protein
VDPHHLLRVGRIFSALWAFGLVGAAMVFFAVSGMGTPIVVLALSIASITYGGLLGTYILAGTWPRARSRDVIVAVIASVASMLIVVFANYLTDDPASPVAALGRLAWPWYVPLGTTLTVVFGMVMSLLPRKSES